MKDKKIKADRSVMDLALEWSAMYQTLLNAGKISKKDNIGDFTNDKLQEMIETLEGEKEVERLRKLYVIEDKDLKNYNITKNNKDD